jgi:hypothetical protein
MEVGRLIDLGVVAVTSEAAPVVATSRITMAVSIQAEPDNAGDILVGDATRQSRRLATRDIYVVQVGDANNVYIRTPLNETGNVNIHLLVPPGAA